jgi:hypothetical protein
MTLDTTPGYGIRLRFARKDNDGCPVEIWAMTEPERRPEG